MNLCTGPLLVRGSTPREAAREVRCGVWHFRDQVYHWGIHHEGLSRVLDVLH